ncbi:MAG: hypothetical protein KGI58_03960 [Patescibacteria group bacterium]|nr:hypothetical protein [Patescibacteria group bacterium]
MWRHYVYIHFKKTDGKPFYVGKGSNRLRDKKQYFERAIAPHKNQYWENVVNKHGFVAQIIMSCQTDKEAQFQEKELIKLIGRGNLTNLTDGGDGHCGITVSDELRKKRSLNARGKRNDNWINSIRIARKNGGNGGVVKKGDKLPDGWRNNLSKSKLGNKNPWFGKSSPVAKLVLNLETGIFYNSVNDAAIAHCINPKTLYQYLDGSRVNLTSLVRA